MIGTDYFMQEKKTSKVIHSYLKYRNRNDHTTGNDRTMGNDHTTVRTTSSWDTSRSQAEPTVHTEAVTNSVLIDTEQRKQALKEASMTHAHHIHYIQFNSDIVCTCAHQALMNRGHAQNKSVVNEDVSEFASW